VPAALTFGMILFIIEFFLGVTFLFNIKIKQVSWLMLLFMVFFFILTLVLAITDAVTDCGCFGDAIVLTNWQTFFKNIVLIILVLIVFFNRKKFVNKTNPIVQGLIVAIGLAFILWVSIYSIRHLPLVDFMPWNKGSVIAKQVVPQQEIAEIFLVYKNKETGQVMEYTTKTLPYKDTVLWKKLEFVDQKKKVIQPFKEAPIHDFSIDDENKISHNAEFIANPSWQFLLVSYDLDGTRKDCFDRINAFAEQCTKDSISFIGLTGSDWTRIDYFRHDVMAKFNYYSVDGTALKSVVRSNPGLVLLKDGVVLDKWAWRDIPTYAKFKEQQSEYCLSLNDIKNKK